MNAVIHEPASALQRERRMLGFAGLTPFVAGAGVLALTTDPSVAVPTAEALQIYAALIASFLGAVHWGLVTFDSANHRSSRARLYWGVAPALLAWSALVLPIGWSLLALAMLLALVALVDRRLLPLLDPDYRLLRLQLSTVAVISLVLAAIATGSA